MMRNPNPEQDALRCALPGRQLSQRGLAPLILVLCLSLGLSLACSPGSEPNDQTSATAETPSSATPDATEPPLDFSFVIMGCNRVGWDPAHPTPSTANVPQLKQTLVDIADLSTMPRYLFFLGDLVRNEVQDDGSTLRSQLTAWQILWQEQDQRLGLSKGGLQLVPLPGNHEVLASIEMKKADGASDGGSKEYVEIPNPPSYKEWSSWMAAHGYDRLGGNGPKPASDPEDQLVGDNSRMSYSFDAPLADGSKAHFVLLDTDTLATARSSEASCLQDPSLAKDPLPGWIAAHWTEGDIAQAQADDDTAMIFAMGHKPVQGPLGSDTQGRANILNCSDYPLADRLLGTMQANPKVVAYLTAHTHMWDYRELTTTAGSAEEATTGRAVPQVLAGDAGSPLSSGDIFGFTLVEIFTDGKVTATSYGRPAPTPIDNPEAGGPATPRRTVVLREAS